MRRYGSLAAAVLASLMLLMVTITSHAGPKCGCEENAIERQIVLPHVEVRRNPDEYCGSGTCVQIDGESLVLTAAHVVADSLSTTRHVRIDENGREVVEEVREWQSLHLYNRLGGVEWRRRARVAWYSAAEEEGGDDLALLKPDSDADWHHARLRFDRKVKVGEDAWTIGAGGSFHQNLDRTLIADVAFPCLDKTFTAVQGSTWFGSSGGGLYVKEKDGYALVGVVCRLWNPRGNPKAPALCQTPETIRRFVEAYRRHKAEKK